MVERRVRVGKLERVGPAEVGSQPEAGEMHTGDVELTFLDVDTGQLDAGKGLPEDSEHRAHAAPDLEQARPGRQRGPGEDQVVAPVLGLPDEALLLLRRVAVDVSLGHLPAAHATRTGP